MGFMGNIIINSYSIMILFILYVQTRRKAGRNTLQDRLFTHILWLTAVMLLSDSLGRLDGRPDIWWYVLANRVANFLLFLLNPVLPSIWLLYVHAQVHQDDKRTKRVLIPCGIYFAAHTVLLLITQFTGWVYTIDEQNVYHRGPLYFLSISMVMVLLVASIAMILRNRRKMGKSHFRAFLLFAVPPVISVSLHFAFYGISIVLNGVVISTLIVYLNVQNRSMITDYLTDVYNRKGFDLQLREKIHASTFGHSFAAILLDYDQFKYVNDTFGHDMGDMALQKSAELLRSSIRSNDFIARFGGDEFVILLDTCEKQELEAVVKRVNDNIDKFNQESGLPYTIHFSTGYAVYDVDKQPGADGFVKMLDRMMYQMKHQPDRRYEAD